MSMWAWLEFFAATAVVIFVLACIGTMIASWLVPRQKRLSAGVKRAAKKPLQTTYRWCCPPGLGCNDPANKDGYSSEPCRRQIALKLSDLEETQRLNLLWACLHADPTSLNLSAWANARDDLIEHKFNGAPDREGKEVLGVPTVDISFPPALPERGQVEDQESRSSHRDYIGGRRNRP